MSDVAEYDRSLTETVGGLSPWSEEGGTDGGLHHCYFCRPDLYPPIAKFHTLCSRCGQLIYTPGLDDPRNESMNICGKCDGELDDKYGKWEATSER